VYTKLTCKWVLVTLYRCYFIVYCSGVKQVDIAATLEHLRDQRHLMVHTKVFNFFPSKKDLTGWWKVLTCLKRMCRFGMMKEAQCADQGSPQNSPKAVCVVFIHSQQHRSHLMTLLAALSLNEMRVRTLSLALSNINCIDREVWDCQSGLDYMSQLC